MTIKELYILGKKELAEADESLIFLEEFYGITRQDTIIRPNFEVDESKFLDAIARRKKGEPLQYILGYWYFDDVRLVVKDGVLIPREDTMVVVNSAIDYIKNEKMVGLDLCSGTGAIAVSVAKNCKNARIEALELYPTPLECLKENVKDFENISFKKADVMVEYENYSNLDFIISNPPYIAKKEIETLQIEVQNEPHTALDGGDDGLDFYKVICSKWSKCLKTGGLLTVEIGEDQGQDVLKLFKENGFENAKILKDFSNHDRVVCGNLSLLPLTI